MLGSKIHYLVIAILTNVIAVISAFLVHRNLVFRSTEHWQSSFFRFYQSQLVALGFGILGLYGLVEFAHLNAMAAQALIMIASLLLTYLLHRHYSFRKR